MKATMALLLALALLGTPGCALLKKGYRVCVGYMGAEVCLDQPTPATPATNAIAAPKIFRAGQGKTTNE